MSITSGSYTIGTGGDYATLRAFIDDISTTSVNGDITGTFISDVTDLNNYTKSIYMKGYTLTITSSVYHNGYLAGNARLKMYNLTITIKDVGSKLIINNISMELGLLNLIGETNASYTTITIKYCFIKINLNQLTISRATSYFFRNMFYLDCNGGGNNCSFDIDLYNTHTSENNSYYMKAFIQVRSGNNNNITFRNNLLYNYFGVVSMTVGWGVVGYGYNNTSNRSDMINALFPTGASGNLNNVNYTPELISTTQTDSNFFKVANTSSIIANGGVTPTISGNNKGIRLNDTPHNTYYSIGADDYVIPVDPDKIRFTYRDKIVETRLPLYPYTSYIKLPFDKSISTNNRVLLYDYGSLYDKRTCVCKLLMTSTEVSDFNTNILNEYYNNTDDTLTIEMGTRSGFYPFGHDYGCFGPYTVKIDILTSPKLSADFFGMFELEIKFYLCGTPPSVTFETEQSQGSVTIGTVSGVKFPQNYYQPKRSQEWVNTELQGVYNTNRVIRDMYYVDTQFNLNCNISKMQRLLQYITSTNRANKYNISSDSGGYIMGYDNGTGTKTINGTLLNNELVITTNNYNDIDISLSFGSERSDIT